mgnify:CR=1 FL=1
MIADWVQQDQLDFHWDGCRNVITASHRALGDAGAPLRALRAVGYDEALEVLAGRLTRAEAAASIDRRTRQLAKRQRTWFRHQVEAERLDATARDAAGLLAAALRALGGAPGVPPEGG